MKVWQQLKFDLMEAQDERAENLTSYPEVIPNVCTTSSWNQYIYLLRYFHFWKQSCGPTEGGRRSLVALECLSHILFSLWTLHLAVWSLCTEQTNCCVALQWHCISIGQGTWIFIMWVLCSVCAAGKDSTLPVWFCCFVSDLYRVIWGQCDSCLCALLSVKLTQMS